MTSVTKNAKLALDIIHLLLASLSSREKEHHQEFRMMQAKPKSHLFKGVKHQILQDTRTKDIRTDPFQGITVTNKTDHTQEMMDTSKIDLIPATTAITMDTIPTTTRTTRDSTTGDIASPVIGMTDKEDPAEETLTIEDTKEMITKEDTPLNNQEISQEMTSDMTKDTMIETHPRTRLCLNPSDSEMKDTNQYTPLQFSCLWMPDPTIRIY